MNRKPFLVSVVLFISFFLAVALVPRWLADSRDGDETGRPGRHHLVPILCFHNVDGHGIYSISRQSFRDHLEQIRKAGILVVPMRTLYRHAVANRLMPQPSAVITIDDDYANIVRVAAPILREYGYPATFFVYTKEIATDPRQGMSWDDLNRLRSEGFDVQNHSYSHTRFHEPNPGESPAAYEDRIRVEIVESRRHLREKLPGADIYAFAYPMGYYSNAVRDRLFQNGYRLLLTTDASPVDLTKPFDGTLHRYTIQKPGHLINPDEIFRLHLGYARRVHPSVSAASTADLMGEGLPAR